MPREDIPSERIYREYSPGEQVPNYVDGELVRIRVLGERETSTNVSDQPGILEDEGLDTPQQVAAERANTRRMNARMAEVNAGFVPSEKTFNRMIAFSIGTVVVTWALLEYFDKLGPLGQ